uniref:Tyr recombinase domain-containing protein n=1 Tax=Poecilia formosa TaxID=48698 RepID=A0A096LV06_POEFO
MKSDPSPQAYRELCRTTLAKIILFNRRRGGEVSKMQLSAFLERDTTPLHKDVAVGLTEFERQLCAHFSRVEIKGKRGRKVAVLLSPDMVEAITQLISKRRECGVPDKNTFLFAIPNCLTPYRGQDCLRVYANDSGAQSPELLRSTQLRKHVATLSQVLNLRNHELDQVANFLGHDIRVHREYYRLPEATTQLAKISKLLLAMERGTLANLQGKTLEEIEIEVDELELSDTESGQSEVDCD